MVGLKLGLEVSGTIMQRAGGLPPLLAVSSMLNGHVVQAALIEPDTDQHVRDMMEASVQPAGPSVRSGAQP